MFSKRDADPARELFPVSVPCGRCIGCRLEKSRQWAVRCVHEASLYDANCFITLTYDNEHLPANGSIEPEEVVLFMKRLRKRFGEGIRSFGCAEYGEKKNRPHYHICLFNFDFKDKKLFTVQNGFNLYISESLSELWGKGHCLIGALTFDSAAYVARYVTKKMTGKKAVEKYYTIDQYGEILQEKLPERAVAVSRRPGLGRPWLEKYKTDVYPGDFVVHDGKKFKPPKYYDYRFEIDEPEKFRYVAGKRKMQALEGAENNTPDRLAVREEIKEIKMQLLKRGYENET